MYNSLRNLSKMLSSVIFLLTLICHTFTQQNICLSPRAGDQLVVADTSQSNLTSSYCVPLIRWPVSQQTLNSYEERDAEALSNYKILFEDYYKKEKVGINCLGMARYFFCAEAYPTCNGTDYTINHMCNWMCDLWAVRCGNSDEFYQSICKNTKGTLCKNQLHLSVPIILAIFLALMLFLL